MNLRYSLDDENNKETITFIISLVESGGKIPKIRTLKDLKAVIKMPKRAIDKLDRAVMITDITIDIEEYFSKENSLTIKPTTKTINFSQSSKTKDTIIKTPKK